MYSLTIPYNLGPVGGNCHTREAGNTPSMEGGVLPLCLKMSKLLIEEEGEGSAASDLMHPKGSRWKTLEDYFARRIYSVTIATESFRFLLQSDLGSTHVSTVVCVNDLSMECKIHRHVSKCPTNDLKIVVDLGVECWEQGGMEPPSQSSGLLR